MLLILTETQLIPPQLICQNCVLADRSGQPRWHQGQLDCGRPVQSQPTDQPPQYRCQMGFRVTNIQDEG